MANVLTDPKGNPLWIPSDTPGREDWEEIIYGAKNIKRSWYNWRIRHAGGKPSHSTYVHSQMLDVYAQYYRPRLNLQKHPLFGPYFSPFWENYGFLLEEELDEYLSKYAHKLANFDWEDTLRMIYILMDAYIARRLQLRGPQLSRDEIHERLTQEAPIVRELYAAEYLYYLGPIKFTLKYSGGVSFPPDSRLSFRLGTFTASLRNTIIFNLFNGEKYKMQCPKKTIQELLSGGSTVFLTQILEVIQLPNVVSVEASHEIIQKPNEKEGTYYETDFLRLLEKIMANYMKFKAPTYFSVTATTTGSSGVLTTTSSPSGASTPVPTTTTPTPSATTGTPPATIAPTQVESPTVTSTAGESKFITGAGSLGLLALAGAVLYLLFRRE
jgi:hypothetical protein